MTKLSILMSAYNSELYIEQSIESILSQTFIDFEFLIIDDGSNDNTYKICENFKKLDPRIILFRNKNNIGLTKSLNKLLDVSSYDLIARQDADDKSYNSRLHKQLAYLDKKNLDFVFSKSLYKKENRVIPRFSNNIPNSIVIKFKNPFIHGTLLGKKNIIFKLGKYNEDFYYAQDYKLVNDIIKSGYKVKIINEVLYESNFENNISTIKKDQQSYYADCVRKNIKPNPKFI